jgi:hypothetical protein
VKHSVINQWLSFAANLGVLGGIIFLAIEIQQNTAVTRSMSAHEIADSSLDFFMRVAENPDLAKLVKIANEDPGHLSDVEIVQYQYLTGAVFMLLEGTYKQHQLGFLSDSGWKPYERLIKNFLSNPVSRDWWVAGHTVFSPEFEAMVEEISGIERNTN